MKKHNLAFIDVETTGFDPDTHELIEIGLVLVRQSENSTKFEVIEELELKIKPERIEDADPQALRVNGYDESAWLFASDLKDAMTVFQEKTKDAIFVAHNLVFDYSFISHAFKKTGLENKMHYIKIDTITLAFAKLHKNNDVERFSLHKLTQHFGIENERAHSALPDTRATFELYKKLMNL
jgi:DNA polymerase-3 subunit epsilon